MFDEPINILLMYAAYELSVCCTQIVCCRMSEPNYFKTNFDLTR